MSYQKRPTAPATITTAEDYRQYPQQPSNNQYNTNPRPANLAPQATDIAPANTHTSLNERESYENTRETPPIQVATTHSQQPTPSPNLYIQMRAGFQSAPNTRLPEEHDCYENTQAQYPPVNFRPNAQAKLRRIPPHSPHPPRTNDNSATADAIPDDIRPLKEDRGYANTPDYSTTNPALLPRIRRLQDSPVDTRNDATQSAPDITEDLYYSQSSDSSSDSYQHEQHRSAQIEQAHQP
jgi:hypothetical protein